MRANHRINCLLTSGLFFACLWLASGLEAIQTSLSPSGPASFLDMPVSARISAMGGAFTALADDSDALTVNPGGLALLPGQEFSFSHDAWLLGINDEHLSYALPFTSRTAVAAGLDFINFGSIDRTTLDSSGNPVANGSVSAVASQVDFAVSQAFGDVGLGGNLKYFSQNIDSYSASSLGVDLGALWKPSTQGLSLGLAIQNLGAQISGTTLPVTFRGGAGYSLRLGLSRPEESQDQLNMAGDLAFSGQDMQAMTVGLGGEYWYHNVFAARLGYKFANNNPTSFDLSGLAFGLGARYEWLQLDYAFIFEGDLGNGNQVSLSARF